MRLNRIFAVALLTLFSLNALGARSLIATDAFTYTDGAFSSVATANWTDQTGVNSQVSIDTNRFRSGQSNPGACRRSAGTYAADQYAVVQLIGTIANNSDKIGVTLRNNGTQDPNWITYVVAFSDTADGTVEIARLTSTGYTVLASDDVQNFVATDTIEGEAEDIDASTVQIRAYKNGALILSFDDTSGSRITAAGRPGIYATQSGGGVFGDNFEGGDLTAGGGGTGILLKTRRRK